MIRTETSSTIERRAAGEVVGYPVPSIPGCAGRGNAHGWIARKLDCATVMITLSNTDALVGGLAIPLHQLLAGLDLTTIDIYMEMSDCIRERDERIAELEKQIGKLNDKLSRHKKHNRTR